MTVAFDARTGSLTLSYTHTPVGTPRGVLVEVTDFNVSTDRVTGITYGGVAMTEVTGSPAIHNSTEDGTCHAYFLGASIPTGAQTVVISVTAGTPRSACRTYTAAADTVIQDSDSVDSFLTSGDITGTLQLGGKDCVVTECWFTATGSVAGIAPLTNWTSARETDEGTGCTGEYDYDIVGTSDVTFGVAMSTAEDVIVLAVAITEVSGGVAVGPASADAASAVVAPGTVLGALAIAPVAVTAAGDTVAPTVVAGSATDVAPAAVTAAGTVVAPTVRLGSITLGPGAVSAAGTVADPTVVITTPSVSVAITPVAAEARGEASIEEIVVALGWKFAPETPLAGFWVPDAKPSYSPYIV